jgi:DnaJ-class molecular chaperone
MAKKKAQKAGRRRNPKTRKMYCDYCDGVGWYEGKKGVLQATCEKCAGTGIIEVPV